MRIAIAAHFDTQNWSPASQAISTYDYGKLGNREKHKYRGPPQITYAHDAANRMTTLAGQSQSYDDAGNQLTGFSADRGTSYVYKYDHNNRLIEVWNSGEWDATPNVTVSQAFSDVGNPFMFQGRPHFALDTLATATAGKLNPIDMPAKREVLTRAPKPNAAEAVWQGFSWNDPQGMAGAAMLLVDLPPSRH